MFHIWIKWTQNDRIDYTAQCRTVLFDKLIHWPTSEQISCFKCIWVLQQWKIEVLTAVRINIMGSGMWYHVVWCTGTKCFENSACMFRAEEISQVETQSQLQPSLPYIRPVYSFLFGLFITPWRWRQKVLQNTSTYVPFTLCNVPNNCGARSLSYSQHPSLHPILSNVGLPLSSRGEQLWFGVLTL